MASRLRFQYKTKRKTVEYEVEVEYCSNAFQWVVALFRLDHQSAKDSSVPLYLRLQTP